MTELSPPFSPDFESDTSWLRGKLAIIAGLLVVIAAGAAGYWFFLRDSSTEAPPAQQQTATAATGNLVTSLSTTGTAASTLSSRLTFGTSAKVASVSAKLGEKVAAGQELAALDSADLVRKLESAKTSLATAQLRLSDLLKAATASELSTAQASIATAQVQLTNAEENLRKAQPGADADGILAADNAVASADQSLTTAKNQVQSAWISLINAQRSYCSTDNHLTQACYEADLPLSQAKVDALIAEVRNPATNAVATAAQGFISASTAYGNSLTGVTNAEKSLATAKEKRQDFDLPPTAIELQQLNSAIQTARASVLSAQQRYDDLVKGADAVTLAQQQESVKSAQLAVETAQANLDAAVLRAPFAGTITAVGISVGDSAGAATAAFTITNTEAVRVDLNVQEADFVGLAAGQYGTATFDALEGYTYIVRITSVNPSPTTTQGVVSYQVQAEILGPAALQDPATQQAALQAMATLSGGQLVRGTGGPAGQTPGGQAPGQTAGGQAPAVQTARAGGQAPPALQTARAGGQAPGAQGTPGAGGPITGGPGGAQAVGGLQNLLNAPTPTPGMNANVTILKSVVENALLVPSNAVRSVGTAKSVTVKKDDGTTEQRPVQTGATNGTNTVITSGLTEGEVVVVAAANAGVTGAGQNQQPGFQTNGVFIGGGPGPGGGANAGAGGVR